MSSQLEYADIRSLADPFSRYISMFGHKTFTNFDLSQLDGILAPIIIDVYVPKIGLAIILDAQQPNEYYELLNKIFNHILLVRRPQYLDNKLIHGIKELDIKDYSRQDIESCLIRIVTHIHAESQPLDFKTFHFVMKSIVENGIDGQIVQPASLDPQKSHIYELSKRTVREIGRIIKNNPEVLYSYRGGHLYLPCALWESLITNSIGTNFDAVIDFLYAENCVIKKSQPSHIRGKMNRSHILRIDDINKLLGTTLFE